MTSCRAILIQQDLQGHFRAKTKELVVLFADCRINIVKKDSNPDPTRSPGPFWAKTKELAVLFADCRLNIVKKVVMISAKGLKKILGHFLTLFSRAILGQNLGCRAIFCFKELWVPLAHKSNDKISFPISGIDFEI